MITHCNTRSTRSIKIQQKLRSQAGKAIADYRLIHSGDKVMVCLSGGKDSFTMLDVLLSLRKHAPIDFDIVAVHLDQKQPGHDASPIADFCRQRQVEFHCIEKDTYSIVTDIIPQGKTMCGLCSRLRRGNLYSHATAIGARTLALGHHREDIVETFFLNMFFGATAKAMPVKLLSERNLMVIRPLAYCRETDIAAYARHQAYPIIPCNLCGSQDNLQRQQIKAMLAQWEKASPGRVENIFRSLANIKPSQLLDTELFDFHELDKRQSGVVSNRIAVS